MNAPLILVSVVLAGALSACERAKEPDVRVDSPVSVVNIQPPPQVPAPTAANESEKAKTPPIQGQVDTREPAQRKAFEPTK